MTVSLIGLGVLAIGVTLWGLRTDAIADASNDAGNIATVLAEQTTRSVQSVDIVITELQEKIALHGGSTPEYRDRFLQSEAANRILKERLERLSQADVIAFTDKNGKLVNTSRTWPSPDLDLSDRDYYQYFKNNADNGVYISNLLVNRTSGERTLFFTKGIRGPNDEFLGVILVGVKLAYFQHIYNSITSLRHQSFLFLRKDGSVLVRHPDPEIRAGYKMPASSPWYGLVSGGGGHYRSPGYFDGVARIVAVRPLRDYPVVINVAVSEEAALTNWKRRAIFIGAGTLLAVLCSLLLLKALNTQFRRLLDSEASLAERESNLAEKSDELERANARVDAALNNMTQGLAMFDQEERLLVCNERYLQLYGLTSEQVKPGCSLRDLLTYRKAAGTFVADIDEYIVNLRAVLARGESEYLTTHLGDGRVVAVHNRPAAGGGWVATHEDITERQRVETRVAHMARHDSLTDLANRVLFREKMDDALARLQRYGDKFSLFVFDLDMFKAVNDSLGHPVGDALLKAVAQRLRGLVRETDTVGRLGGDEFAIIQIGERNQKEGAVGLANRLLETISKPYQIDGNDIVVGISIGIALAPHDGADADALLKNADLALYRAKSEGRKDYRFFEANMDMEIRMRRAMEVDLRNAMARDEFEIHYQTVIDSSSSDTCGVEALIRWRHPQHGLVAPDRFIPLAEEIGLIIPLGEWILRKACTDAAHWPGHIKLAVNLSPIQFRNGNLVGIVRDALAESGFSPRRLELEITESVLLQKNANNLGILHELKRLGVGIVLDDFGTGYSSLSYLRMFPFDKIKIDKSFVAEMPNSADCAAIVCAITGLGRSLGIETTAEGVETEEQFSLLRAAGCTHAQGYLFSKPRPLAELAFTHRGKKEKAA
jgi:diguanylate cyclase (GGDEF)-like protein/PAS domain S-box-containing protein